MLFVLGAICYFWIISTANISRAGPCILNDNFYGNFPYSETRMFRLLQQSDGKIPACSASQADKYDCDFCGGIRNGLELKIRCRIININRLHRKGKMHANPTNAHVITMDAGAHCRTFIYINFNSINYSSNLCPFRLLAISHLPSPTSLSELRSK